MKISHISTSTYRIPPTVPWEDATHSVSGIEFVISKITTDTGLVGTGISYTVGIGGSSIQALIDDYLGNMIIGEDPLRIERIWSDLNGQLHRCGTGISQLALAAIDTALWDIAGKYYNQPLYKLIGGARHQIIAYASGIDFHLPTDELLQLVDDYMARGYQNIKIKIGKPDPMEDVERIRKVKERIGPGRKLMVDANQKWSAAQSIQSCSFFDEFCLGWIEEPISSDDIEGHSRLRQSITTPVAVGESLYTKHQFLDYMKANAVDIVQPDVARVGGITEFIKISNLANSWHKPVAPHFLMELSVSLLCGIPNALILENVAGGSLSEMGVLHNPIVVKNGYCSPPAGPGHGILFHEAELEKYRLDPDKLREQNLRSKKVD